MSAAPNAQFKPMVRGLTCLMEFQKALTVCPDNILPDASVTVPDIMRGSRIDCSSNSAFTANNAALQFRVSKTVSTKMISTPPLISALVCSR